MRIDNQRLSPGSYRLVKGVRLVRRGDSTYAICDYPMRVVRLTPTIAALLSLCKQEQTCEQLAHDLAMPLKRVEMLCDQLRWKMLLEAGPLSPLATWPPVSIIIPTYNRARELERCLRSLFELDYPTGNLEILVVDDGSTDTTQSIVQPMILEAKALGIGMRIVRHEKQQGVAVSRNTGAQAAQHALMAYLDSDCVASPTWLTELVPAFKDARIAAVGGMIRAYERGSMLGRYEDTRSSLFMGKRAQQVCLEGPLTYLPTANLLIRRATWQQLGGFAPLTFGEDVDFCRRLLATGARILYLPQGTVYHDYRTTLGAFLRIRVAYASAEAALLQHHPTERRTLLLPPEQAAFAGLALGGLCGLAGHARDPIPRQGKREAPTLSHPSPLAPTVPVHHCATRLDVLGHDGMLGNGRLHARTWRGAGRGKGRVRGDVGASRLPFVCALLLRRRKSLIISLFLLTLAFVVALVGAGTRLYKVRVRERLPVSGSLVVWATLRGHMAYVYHLSRHLTRYYTLPLLLASMVIPPLAPLLCVLYCIVIGVDYVRLRPDMGLSEYVLCSMLDDCAYEVGVIWGCIKFRMWKPLFPIVRRRM
ncbi:MAG TPA: mycofactocin biosynthesis glycosyltransferase MftF [Ktedonobacteraceae bacterium]|nr:mycofactocin biosynthesis glycosyltransferase MftF [Ktedonobacteraceae bacterium]